MVDSPSDDRPPMVVAMQWVSRITTISLEMSLPPGLGYWLDEKWDSGPWLVIFGAVIGFAVAMKHLMQLASATNSGGSSSSRKPKS